MSQITSSMISNCLDNVSEQLNKYKGSEIGTIDIYNLRNYVSNYSMDDLDKFYEELDCNKYDYKQVLIIAYCIFSRYGLTVEEYKNWCNEKLGDLRFIPLLFVGVTDADAEEALLKRFPMKEEQNIELQQSFLQFSDEPTELQLFDKYLICSPKAEIAKKVCSEGNIINKEIMEYFNASFDSRCSDVDSCKMNIEQTMTDFRSVLIRKWKKVVNEVAPSCWDSIESEFNEYFTVKDIVKRIDEQIAEAKAEHYMNSRDYQIEASRHSNIFANGTLYGRGASGILGVMLAQAAVAGVNQLHNNMVYERHREQQMEEDRHLDLTVASIYSKKTFSEYVSGAVNTLYNIVLNTFFEVSREQEYAVIQMADRLYDEDLDSNQYYDIAFKVLFAMPYSLYAYKAILRTFYNVSKDLLKIANHFGVDLPYDIKAEAIECKTDEDFYGGNKYPTIHLKNRIDKANEQIKFLKRSFDIKDMKTLSRRLRFRIKFKTLFDSCNAAKSFSDRIYCKYLKDIEDRTLTEVRRHYCADDDEIARIIEATKSRDPRKLNPPKGETIKDVIERYKESNYFLSNDYLLYSSDGIMVTDEYLIIVKDFYKMRFFDLDAVTRVTLKKMDNNKARMTVYGYEDELVVDDIPSDYWKEYSVIAMLITACTEFDSRDAYEDEEGKAIFIFTHKNSWEQLLAKLDKWYGKYISIKEKNEIFEQSRYSDELLFERVLLKDVDSSEYINTDYFGSTTFSIPKEPRNIRQLWTKVESGDGFAEWTILNYYFSIIEDDIENYDFDAIASKLTEVKKYGDKYIAFALYLYSYVYYKCFTQEGLEELEDKIDLSEAIEPLVENIKQSAEMGVASAYDTLGYWYQEGLNGFTKSDSKAVEYYEKASRSNHPEGLYHLGLCYRNGIGVEQNPLHAYDILKRSADMGHTKAKRVLLGRES